MAKSYNLKNAINGNYPGQRIDYSKIRFTEGDLAIAENAAVSAVNERLPNQRFRKI